MRDFIKAKILFGKEVRSNTKCFLKRLERIEYSYPNNYRNGLEWGDEPFV